MVIMSDGEAFALKLVIFLLLVGLIILIFVKPGKQANCADNDPNYSILPEPTTIVDTLYLRDTVYITKKSKPDTVYITIKDSI